MRIIIAMLKFYQKARQLNHAHAPQPSLSIEKEQSNDVLLLYKRRAKVLKRARAKENLTMIRLQAQEVSFEEESCASEMKHRLFKNAAIKQKLKDLQIWKAEERIRKKMRKETIELTKCQHSVHEYLVKKIKQNIQRAEDQKLLHSQHSVLKNSLQRGQTRRYKTLNQEQAARRSQLFASTITESISGKAELMRSSLLRESRRQSRESSNLISQDESLLAHIAKKQKEYQQKSLKIVTLRNRSSMQQPHKSSDNPMAVSSQRWHCNRDQTKHLKSHSTRKHAVQCITASRPPKQSTQNLIKPWDAQSRYQ